MIRAVVADDQALVRAGFVVLLDSADDIEVVGQAATGRAAVDVVRQTAPDVVLMDVQMPQLDGLEATALITADPVGTHTRVLMLTTFDLDEYVFRALEAGASGFLLKDTEPGQLLEAVRVVAGGDALLAPSVTRRLISRFVAAGRSPRTSADPRLERLTDREREVLVHLAHGLSNRDLADRLCMGYATVKTHVSRLLTKLDLHDRAQLVVFAYETGLVGRDGAAV